MTKGRPSKTKKKAPPPHSANKNNRHSQPKSPPRKRPRPTTTAVVASQQPQQRDDSHPPSPPPPPPRSLIRLLETDSDVLHYFQKLQENLQWDVQKWKRRARRAKQEQQEQPPPQDDEKTDRMDDSIIDNDNDSNKSTTTQRVTTRRTRNNTPNVKKKKDPPNDGTLDDDKKEESSSSLPSPPLPPTTKKVAPSSIALSSSSSSNDDDDDDDPDTWFSWEDDPPLPPPVDDGVDDQDSSLVAMAENERITTTEQKKHRATTTTTTAAAPAVSSFGMHRLGRRRRQGEDNHPNKDDHLPDDYSTSSDDEAESFLPPPSSRTKNYVQDGPFTSFGGTTATTARRKRKSPDDDDQQQQQHVTSLAMKHLTQAYEELQDMGILLLNVNVKEEEILQEESIATTSPDNNHNMEPGGVAGSTKVTSTGTTQDATFTSGEEDGKISSSAATNTITIRYYQRRSNRDVITQILLFLKALAKMKHVVGATSSSSGTNPTTTRPQRRPLYYYPFMAEPSSSSSSLSQEEGGDTEATPPSTHEHVPCYRPLSHVSTEWQHPAVKGMDQLLHALVAIDLWSGLVPKVDDDNDDNDDELSKPKTQQDLTLQEQVVWGMQGRETLVSNCLNAWHGEMVETWAVQDRSLRLVAESTHLDFHNPHHHPGNQTTSDDDHDDNDHDDEVEGGLPASIKLLPYGHKNHLRFSNLMERCLLMKLATSLYLTRGDGMTVFALLYKYVVSTAPSRSLEDYPRLAPVQSLCVVEAMLTARSSRLVTKSPRSLADWMTQGETYVVSSGLRRAFKESFRVTAEIFSQRNLPHKDDRVTDLSKVELAAYQRLMTAFPELLADETNNSNTVSGWASAPKHLLELILAGDAATIDAKMKDFLSIFTSTIDSDRLGDFLASLSAKRELEIRQWETYRHVVQTPMIFAPNHTGTLKLQELSFHFVDAILNKSSSRPATTAVIATAFRVCHLAADGVSLVRLASWCISQLAQRNNKEDDEYVSSSLLGDLLETSAQVPTVRVINLERRPDRLAMFHTQAMMHHLSVLPGVANLSPSWNKDRISNHQVDLSWLQGTTTGFAIDGQGKAAEVEGRLIDGVGGGDPDALNALVRTHWYPHELQPFDFDAPKDPHAVLISPSEKACALSHIACWKGVVASFSLVSENDNDDDDDDDAAPAASKVFRSIPHLRQRFLISGYAKGPCIMMTGGEDSTSGTSMYDTPTPVCLILEDDAMLVDRFSERLAKILEELPRDFHVCSLGYSRPKTAPLVPFSDHLSVPTSIWYLTGYLVSLRGAQYLLQHLPVQGPVDSWIGLQLMFTQNWDNSFGHALGVGVSTKAPLTTTTTHHPSSSSMTKKEWQQILRFRAFCATTPLCSQRVGLTQEHRTAQTTTNLAAATGGKSGWRQRDTDIVYSGHG